VLAVHQEDAVVTARTLVWYLRSMAVPAQLRHAQGSRR